MSKKNPWPSKDCSYNQFVDEAIYNDKPINFGAPVRKLVQLSAAILDQCTGPGKDGPMRDKVVKELNRLHDEITASFLFNLPTNREKDS